MASFAPIRGTRAQIQATPIVDGQFLVETDQGVDNKIYMDEGSTRTIVGGNTVTGVLPELYIYSETGSVVTVEDAGGTSIPTSQVGTDHWICEVPDYGIYNIYSLLDGETTTQSINVDDCMIYTIDDSHFHCNVIVTYPSGVGASCQISGGGETYSAPALNPPDTSYKFVVHGKNTTYTITTNVDGAIKTQTVTTGTILDQTYEVTMPYARVNLTVEAPPIIGNITCTDGTTTIVKTVTPNMVFYLPNTGSWTFTGSDGVDIYDTTVEVNDLSVVYNEDLSSAPDGSTVLPTDDIQTWLLCAKIKDKTTYTTLDDVLNDNETLQKLISSDNAMNYLVRSTSWTTGKGLVPTMTSNTAPSGEVLYNNYYNPDYPWYAFDGNVHPTQSTNIYTSNQTFTAYVAESEWIGYKFTSPTRVTRIDYTNSKWAQNVSFYVEGKNNSDANWTRLNNGVALTAISPDTTETFVIENYNKYDSYRLLYISGQGANGGANCPNVAQVQFYACAEDIGICDDSIAMRLIGEKNYASDLLLDNSDWNEAITQSAYSDSVLNATVPHMTGYTTPEGTVFAPNAHSSWLGWRAFDGIEDSNRYSPSSAGIFPDILGYIFTAPHVLKSVMILPYYSNGLALQDYTIEGSNDTTTGSDGTWDVLYTGSATNEQQRIILPLTNNSVAYKAYRIKATSSYTNYLSISEMQFYCRDDADETIYHIYSAADDTIIATPQGGGAAVIITTNNDGYGTIAKTSLPNDIYTLVSSKAKDPDNLNNDYSKQVIVNNGTIEVALMPDNCYYWWGYINNMEDTIATNGWSVASGCSMASPTKNINDMFMTASGSQFVLEAINHIVPNGTIVKALMDCTVAYAGGGSVLEAYSTKAMGDGTGYIVLDRFTAVSSIALKTITLPQDGYVTAGSINSRAGHVYAIWID